MAVIKDNTTDYGTGSINKTYDDYVTQLKNSKLNAQAELTSAQQKSSSLMNNYLKALGVMGSGAGMSAYSDSNMAYANAVNKSNQNYDNEIVNYTNSYYDKYTNDIKELYNNGNLSTTALGDAINNNPNNPNNSSLELYYNASKQKDIDDLNEGLNYYNTPEARDFQSRLENVEYGSDDYYNLVDEINAYTKVKESNVVENAYNNNLDNKTISDNQIVDNAETINNDDLLTFLKEDEVSADWYGIKNENDEQNYGLVQLMQYARNGQLKAGRYNLNAGVNASNDNNIYYYDGNGHWYKTNTSSKNYDSLEDLFTTDKNKNIVLKDEYINK